MTPFPKGWTPKGGLLAGGVLAGWLLWNWLNNDRDPVQPLDDPQVSWGQLNSLGQSRYRQVGSITQARGFDFATQQCTTPAATINNNVGNWSDWGQYRRIFRTVAQSGGQCSPVTVYRWNIELVNGAEVFFGQAGAFWGWAQAQLLFEWEFRSGAQRDSRAPAPIPSPLEPLPLPWGPAPAPLRRRQDDEEAPPFEPWAPELPRLPKAPPAAPTIPPERSPLGPGELTPSRPGSPERTLAPGRLTPGRGAQPARPVLPLPTGPQPGIDGDLDPNRNPDGSPVQPEPVPQTDPETEVFIGEEIGQPGQRPRPTPEGTAAELGRLEQKLRIIGERPELPDEPVDLGPVLRRLDDLEDAVELLTAPLRAEFDGDSYELQPPCGRDAGGNPLPPDVAAWQGGEGMFLKLSRQLDALALLLQYAKDQRQPICKGRPIGEEVSVNFREVP